MILGGKLPIYMYKIQILKCLRVPSCMKSGSIPFSTGKDDRINFQIAQLSLHKIRVFHSNKLCIYELWKLLSKETKHLIPLHSGDFIIYLSSLCNEPKIQMHYEIIHSDNPYTNYYHRKIIYNDYHYHCNRQNY